MDSFIVNLCPTGMIPTKSNTPHVPITPKEIAEDVRRCREAGASIAHLHARDDDGDPTWQGERFGEIVEAVLDRVPDLIICVTTSGRNWQDFPRRSESLRLAGRLHPEMASLTLGSMNFPTTASVNPPDMIVSLAGAMQDAGIVPECEVFDVGMSNYLATLHRQNVLAAPLYCNILLGSKGTADLSPLNLAAILAALPAGTTWALAGIGRYQLQANTLALALGGHVRIGLEDNPYFDWDTKDPASNPRLVERIVRIARELGRTPATPEQARQIIGLKVPERLK
ncbi:MAG: 3-keto-5-aminohexanoate cleavage protein [Novosphingobium sp.]